MNKTNYEHSKEGKLEAINEAQEKMNEIIALLEPIAEDDPNFRAYWLDHFRILTGEGHGFLSRDLNLDEVRERTERGDEEE